MNLPVSDEVVLLRAQVDYLLERLSEMPGLALRPVNWADLDQPQAAEQWSLLTAFVDRLRDHYGLVETIGACWYVHPAQREELSALRTAWAGSYQDPTARPGDAVAWHDMLDRVLCRLREWDRTGCADGRHHPDVDVPANDADDVLRERFIHADLAERSTSQPKTPQPVASPSAPKGNHHD